MANTDRIRSPFDHLLNFIPKGHEEPLKNALYSTTTLIFVSIGCAAAVAVYFILEPFFKPLLWAVLIGSILHPFKHQFAESARTWLSLLHSSGTPLLVGTLFLPLLGVDYSAEWLGRKLLDHLRLIIFFIIGVPLAYVLYQYFPLDLVITACDLIFHLMELVTESFTAVLCTSALAGSVSVFLLRNPKDKNLGIQFVSYFVWTFLVTSAVNQTGSWKSFCFLILIAFTIAGYFIELGIGGDVFERDDSEKISDVALQVGSPSSNVVSPTDVTDMKWQTTEDTVIEETVRVVSTPVKLASRVNLLKPSSSSRKTHSNKYIYGTLWACAVILVWKHMWLLHLFPIPLVYFVVKSVGSYFGLWKFLTHKTRRLFSIAYHWCKSRREVLFPFPLKYIAVTLHHFDKAVIKRLEKQVDVVVSAVIIIVVTTLAVLASLFVGVQVYAESVHLVKFTTDLANQTISSYPEVKHWMPQGFNQVVDSVVDNAYIYGRTGIVTLVRGAIQEKDPTRAAQMEQSIMDIIDRIQNAWTTSGKERKVDSRETSIQTVLDGLKKTPANSTQIPAKLKPPLLRRLSQELLNVSALVTFARENVGMLMSILESVWAILKGNLNLLFNAATAILSMVFGGGTAILNFVVNRVIFLTALYYLLVASGPQYKPVQLVSALSPGAGTTLGNAIEDAINTVFLASFKKAAFYGLWTWLVHNIFQVNFIFIPSALAALLGAAPFLGTYWAAVPAALELWLAQGRHVEAVLLMICHFTPMFVVDDAFYAEIKGGGHPYLTGLAVAGGIFWMGLEGAIIGPLLLCMLLVAVTIYSSLMREPTVTEINTRWTQRRLNRTDTVG